VKRGDRKNKIEQTFIQANRLFDGEAASAWRRLVAELDNLSAPESRPPRFNGLLCAIWNAATDE